MEEINPILIQALAIFAEWYEETRDELPRDANGTIDYPAAVAIFVASVWQSQVEFVEAPAAEQPSEVATS